MNTFLSKCFRHPLVGLLLFCAISTDVKADQASMTSLTICPTEATPTEEYQWVCSTNTATEIRAYSNGSVIECFWTPRTCVFSS